MARLVLITCNTSRLKVLCMELDLLAGWLVAAFISCSAVLLTMFTDSEQEERPERLPEEKDIGICSPGEMLVGAFICLNEGETDQC